MARCSSCDARPHFSIRDNFVGDVDTAGGLVLDPVGRWRCPTCGQRFLRAKEDATLFLDSDGYSPPFGWGIKPHDSSASGR